MKVQDVKDMDRNDVLGLLGLQTKESDTARLLGTLGAFAVGLVAGAGVALLLAPKTGRELRDDLRGRLQKSNGSADSDVESIASV